MQNNILELNNISHAYSNNELVLDDISFDFTNKKYVLIGPSGIGKSTLLHIINGIITPTKGKVQSNHKFGTIFQTLNLLNDFTLKENIEITC